MSASLKRARELAAFYEMLLRSAKDRAWAGGVHYLTAEQSTLTDTRDILRAYSHLPQSAAIFAMSAVALILGAFAVIEIATVAVSRLLP